MYIYIRFFDGCFSIIQLVENVSKFGCDVVVIIDYGDYNFKGVFFEEYWQDFVNVLFQFNDLILIVGLEWNILFFVGCEYMILLFFELVNYEWFISLFRDCYDYYGKIKFIMIDESQVLEWLNNQFKDSEMFLVVMYNYFSCKDLEFGENVYDMQKWCLQIFYVIGFFGVLGYQKKCGEDNGFYNNWFKICYGWDFVVVILGNDWDILLQVGL